MYGIHSRNSLERYDFSPRSPEVKRGLKWQENAPEALIRDAGHPAGPHEWHVVPE
jgi:hypothetical protein